MMTMQVWLVS